MISQELEKRTDYDTRNEALAFAVRHRVKGEAVNDVIAAAKKYYEFLKDE